MEEEMMDGGSTRWERPWAGITDGEHLTAVECQGVFRVAVFAGRAEVAYVMPIPGLPCDGNEDLNERLRNEAYV